LFESSFTFGVAIAALSLTTGFASASGTVGEIVAASGLRVARRCRVLLSVPAGVCAKAALAQTIIIAAIRTTRVLFSVVIVNLQLVPCASNLVDSGFSGRYRRE
jgi:hypothetical protein